MSRSIFYFFVVKHNKPTSMCKHNINTWIKVESVLHVHVHVSGVVHFSHILGGCNLGGHVRVYIME